MANHERQQSPSSDSHIPLTEQGEKSLEALDNDILVISQIAAESTDRLQAAPQDSQSAKQAMLEAGQDPAHLTQKMRTTSGAGGSEHRMFPESLWQAFSKPTSTEPTSKPMLRAATDTAPSGNGLVAPRDLPASIRFRIKARASLYRFFALLPETLGGKSEGTLSGEEDTSAASPDTGFTFEDYWGLFSEQDANDFPLAKLQEEMQKAKEAREKLDEVCENLQKQLDDPSPSDATRNTYFIYAWASHCRDVRDYLKKVDALRKDGALSRA